MKRELAAKLVMLAAALCALGVVLVLPARETPPGARAKVEKWEPYTVSMVSGASADLDLLTTPGDYGGYSEHTRNRPSPYDGAWAVYEAADGALVQVAVFGSEAEPSESGAAWRVRTTSGGWGDWNVGTGPYRIEAGSRLPRLPDLQAAPAHPVSVVQASQLDMAAPPETDPDWLLSWLVLIHDEENGVQTAVQCWHGCRSYLWGWWTKLLPTLLEQQQSR